MSTNLTDNQRMLINGFNAEKNPFSFWDGGFKAEDSGTWESSFIPEVAHIIGKPESSAKRTIHDLVKKGIFTSREEEGEEPMKAEDGTVIEGTGRDADHWIELTPAGVELITDLRLADDEAMLELDEMDDDDDEDEPVVKTMISEAGRKANERIKETRARQKAAQEDIKAGKPGLRTSHANCSHATHGKEGKIARAKCRRDRAAAAAKAEEKAMKKAAKVKA